MTDIEAPKEVPTALTIGFHRAVAGFTSSLSDLREFAELVEGLIKMHKLRELESAIARYEGLDAALCEYNQSLKDDIDSIKRQAPDISPSGVPKIKFEVNRSGDGKKTLNFAGGRAEIREFRKTAKAILRSDSSVQHLLRSSLISLVSIVESFLANLLRIFFAEFPSAVNAKDKQFTFEELAKFNSIDDARASLVTWKIENILRGSFEDWIEFLKCPSQGLIHRL